MPWLRPTIRDALGRRFPLVRGPGWKRWLSIDRAFRGVFHAKTFGVDGPEGWREFSKTVGEPWATETRLAFTARCLLGLSMLPLVVAGYLYDHRIPRSLDRWPAAALFAGLIVALLFLAPWLARLFFRNRLAHAYLAARRCPSCGYSLKRLDPAETANPFASPPPPEPRPTTTCPECGGTWRLPLHSPIPLPDA